MNARCTVFNKGHRGTTGSSNPFGPAAVFLLNKTLFFVAFCVVLSGILCRPLAAQPEDPLAGVAVKIWARGVISIDPNDPEAYGALDLSGTFLASSPTANDAYDARSASYNVNGYVLGLAMGNSGFVRVEPGKSYTLTVSSWNLVQGEVNIIAPPGYRVIMDQQRRTRETFDNGANIVFELQSNSRHPDLAGLASDITSNEVNWSLSLGSLRNGGSAGALELVDTGTRSAWSTIFTPAPLFYEPTSDEVSVYRPNGIISQIIANQVVIDVVTLSSTSYEIRCYHPSQMQGTSDPRTFTGSAFATYRIEQGDTSTTLKITKEIRNVTDATSIFSVARAEYLFLRREGSWPTFNWTRTDWSTSSTPSWAPTETYVAGGGTSSNRTEAAAVRQPGAGAATNRSRNYTVPLVNGQSVIGEVLASETLGTSTGLTTSFNYYTNTSDFSSLGHLKSATLPGGGWVAYDYYSTDIDNGIRGVGIKYCYKPYLTAPASIPAIPSASQGEVAYYEYANDVFNVPTRPALIQTSVNGTVVSKTTISYNDNFGSVNGYALTEATRREYCSSSGENLGTVTRYYREDIADKFLRGQTHSIAHPNGVKQAFAYQRGTWNGSAFTADGGVGTGTASRVTVITGSTSSNSYNLDGYTVDAPNFVDSKSTKEVTIRDSRALVVRTESHLWKDNAWQLVTWTNYSYDFGGRLTSRASSNGATYTATYDGGLKSSETDEAGVTTSYTYDAAGRVATATRAGASSGSITIPALTTTYTYDVAGRVTAQQIGSGAGAITNANTFDDAGRISGETPPGGYGSVSYSYDAVNRTKTATRADGSTITTTNYLDGRLSSTTGTGVVPEYHTYGVETAAGLSGQRWHKIDAGASNSVRWSKTWQDWLGRETKTEHPGYTGQPNVVTESFYAIGTGLLAKTTKTGYAPTLYQYNEVGELTRSGLDQDNSGALDLVGNDRITDTNSYVELYNSQWWLRTDTKTYPKLGLNTAVVSSTSRTRLTGLGTSNTNGIRFSEAQSIDAEGNVTTQTVDVNRAAKTSVATTTRTGVSQSMVENTLNGFSMMVSGFDGLSTTKGYDSYLRPSTVTDSRGNTTTTAYIAGTKLVSTVTDAASKQSVTTYDTMGRVSTQRDPLNYYTRFAYNARGQLYRQWGDGAMPVEYGYDSTYGDRTSMKTYRDGSGWDGTSWPTSPGTADMTTWAYDGPSGLLTTKTDALNRAVTQTYNLRGQTATRTLARGVTVTYAYYGDAPNELATGELKSQTYSDGTPTVSYTYGRTGQVETITDTTGTRDLVYDPNKPWRMTAEAESEFYGGRVSTRLYDDSTSGFIGRVRGFQVGAAVGSASDLEQTFGFTTVGRLETITSKRQNDSATARTFRYAYRNDSALLASLSIDGSHPFTITRSYETNRDLITGLDSKWSTTLRTSYAYTYDDRGFRSKVVQSGDAFADYGDVTSQQFAYNGRGELTAAIGYMGSDVTQASKQMPGRRYEYGFDNAGNRQWSNRTGVSTLKDNYTTNALNQYTSRENNTLPVSGTAEADTNPAGGVGGVAVAVQGGTLNPVAAGRQGRYWNDELTVNNNANPASPNPWRGTLTIFTAKRGTSGSPDVYRADARTAEIAARLQTFTYDLDGNLTSDGIADYTWDAENRLIRMETTTAAQTWGFPWRVLEFRYDYMGRRVQKRVLEKIDGTFVEISSRRFLYDGWNVVAEYLAPGGTVCGALVRSYTWGLDIALSQTNAGGVGALLQIADHPTGKTYLPTYDGNGNIVALFNAATSGGSAGALAACYEYSPFGEPLRSQIWDSTIADNPFRFSTKWTDLETGLVYYGHRFYDPKNGRFSNRDPIEESGGLNLYGFCGNNGLNRWDLLGNAWEVEKTADDTFMARAWFSSQDLFIDLGEWNFSSRQDAENWARSRSDGYVDERGEIRIFQRANSVDEAQAAASAAATRYMQMVDPIVAEGGASAATEEQEAAWAAWEAASLRLQLLQAVADSSKVFNYQMGPAPSAFLRGPPSSYDPSSPSNPMTMLMGGIRALGGVFEAVAGVGLAVASGGVGSFAGGLVVLHGLDQIQAGTRQAIGGTTVNSATSAGLQMIGMSATGANAVDAGISIVGSLGAGIATTAIKVSESAALSASGSNMPFLQRMIYYEIGQKTMSDANFAVYSQIANPIDRGAAIVASQGWINAMLPEATGWFLGAGKTLSTGLTPGAWIGVGIGGAAGGVQTFTIPPPTR